jgi:hypothetical protein
VETTLPVGVKTFDPIGWSPSGRFFAVRSNTDRAGADERITVLDATTGSLVATYSVAAGVAAGTERRLDGVAWDPVRDLLYAADWTTDASGTSVCSVFSLDTSATVSSVEPGKARWQMSMTVIGRDARGVLLVFSEERTQTVWRIENGQPVEVGTVKTDDFLGIMRGGYAEGGGLLVQTYRPGETWESARVHVAEAVIDLDGSNLRYVWPQY